MSTAPDLVVVLCTAPDAETAERLAKGLVEARLAACVNAISGVKSCYRWEGAVETDDEVAAWLEEHHPYDVPEIIALPATRVSAGYLAWAVENTGKP